MNVVLRYLHCRCDENGSCEKHRSFIRKIRFVKSLFLEKQGCCGQPAINMTLYQTSPIGYENLIEAAWKRMIIRSFAPAGFFVFMRLKLTLSILSVFIESENGLPVHRK